MHQLCISVISDNKHTRVSIIISHLLAKGMFKMQQTGDRFITAKPSKQRKIEDVPSHAYYGINEKQINIKDIDEPVMCKLLTPSLAKEEPLWTRKAKYTTLTRTGPN